jgi:hypothetical protein
MRPLLEAKHHYKNMFCMRSHSLFCVSSCEREVPVLSLWGQLHKTCSNQVSVKQRQISFKSITEIIVCRLMQMGADDIFIGGLFGAGLLGSDEYMMMKAFESKALKYFPNCPICGSGKIQITVSMAEATVHYIGCGARWELISSLWKGLKSAKLVMESDDGRGKELLGQPIEVTKWQEMAKKSRRKLREKKR